MTFFFFNDTATTESYTLSLHDALPIFIVSGAKMPIGHVRVDLRCGNIAVTQQCLDRTRVGSMLQKMSRDRKSTRLNSSHSQISYAVFCLKKKRHERRIRGSYDFSTCFH